MSRGWGKRELQLWRAVRDRGRVRLSELATNRNEYKALHRALLRLVAEEWLTVEKQDGAIVVLVDREASSRRASALRKAESTLTGTIGTQSGTVSTLR